MEDEVITKCDNLQNKSFPSRSVRLRTDLLVDVETHLVRAEDIGQGEGVDAHRLQLRVGLQPVGVGGLCRPQRMSIVTNGEFPHVLGTDVNLARPHQSAISHKYLVEERLVVQTPPIGFVEITRTVEDGALIRLAQIWPTNPSLTTMIEL